MSAVDVVRRDVATEVAARRVVAGGMNRALLRVEIRRVLRDRSALGFAVLMPVAFFLMWGRNPAYADLPYGRGTVGANIMTGMALYGALISTMSAGTAVSTERATGWSRQLRLTPLQPATYIAVKCFTGMLAGALSITSVYVAAAISGVRMPVDLWFSTGVVTWVGSAIFSAFGLFMGYMFRSENAMKVIGPSMALLAFFGGLFMPLNQMADIVQTIAPYTPMYGIHEIALAPYGEGTLAWTSVINAAGWLAVFAVGAAWRMSKDTARV
ncbi:hypothetical protein KEM60_00242 [Austwickia sp. TVS 96-490-7B]|uniref:ABC transporter permease n=1 Tax=Austwickia sp. TVS 96-490-7B TaxID=2830843 RepID=UPI001C58DE7F|nr:ABC transporter permease [Austwickia sp. TVS 96-490-7B]MBW3084059.1 hypothetical protein [Austwickia sp. TVS 96-490-7B]